MGLVVGIIIGVGAVGFVVWVAVSSYIKKKQGKGGCCGFCDGCTHCSNDCKEK